MNGSRKRMLALAGRALAAVALISLPQAGRADLAPPRDRPLTVDFAFMVGSWTDDGDCANAARLDRDGRFHTADGREGLWVVDGGRLILTGDSTLAMRIVPVDRNTVTVLNANGSRGRSIRCASAGDVGGRAQARVRLDRNYIVGRWTDDGNCSNAADFRANGRFVASTGAEGDWRFAGDRLTMTGTSTLVLRIVPIDHNVMNIVHPDDTLGRSTRC